MAKYADDNGLTHLAGLIITWVKGLLSSTNPLMDGTATPGTAKMLAREDHVHPTDTSRQETLVSGTNIKTVGSQSLLGSGNLTMANIGAAAASHTHGNITSGGDITATAPTIATGDKLIINDESASKVTNGPSFDTSDTAKYLRHDGTWATPPDDDTKYDIETTGSGSNRKLNLLEDGIQKTQVSIPDTNTTYSDFTGATSSAAGAHGLVPAPASGELDSLLFGDGDWDIVDLSAAAGQDSSSNPVIYISLKKHDSSGHLLGSVQLDAATTSSIGLMTAADKTKLNGIATGAEVNQNAFSNVKVGSSTIAADGKTDTLELAAGDNVTLTPNTTDDKVTIAATDSHVQQNGAAGTNSNFQILFTGTPNQTSGAIDSVGFDSVKDFMYNPSTGNLSVTKINTYTLGAACEKSIGAVADNNSGLVTGDAVYDAIQSALGTMADALVYQGTIGAAADSPTITSLPASHSKGDVYIVKTAGTYAGKGCEVGDMIICNTDGTTANNAHWDVIQSNIEALTNSEITTIWNNAVTANW